MLQLGANIHKIFFSSKSFCLKFPQILKIFLKRTFSLYLNYMQNRVSNILVNQRVDILDTAFRHTWVVDKIQARSKFISYWERAKG